MEFQRNVRLAPYTTLKIGGPAEFFCEVPDRVTLAEALKEAWQQKLRIIVLSGGTNTFFPDEGFSGLVLLMRLRGIREEGDRFIVEAGTAMGEVVARTIARGLSGLAWAGGLPGTVGGAVVGNAGTFGHSVSDVVVAIEALAPDGTIRMFPRDECGFSYRTSRFKSDFREYVLTQATLQFHRDDAAALREEMRTAIQFRAAHHPAPSSAGSFFKNPETPKMLPEALVQALSHEHVQQWFDRIPAGWLIDRAGLKGARVGDAMIASQHANFVVNAGNARAADVRALATRVKNTVHERFGIVLEEEVRYLS